MFTVGRILRHCAVNRQVGQVIRNDLAVSDLISSLPFRMQVNGLRTPSSTKFVTQPLHQETVQDKSEDEDTFTKSVIANVNDQIVHGTHGRLFAVVYIASTQFRVTPEDLIVVRGTFAPNIGDKIRLEKVLCVGGKDFTLLGRPLLGKDLVNVEATVVEKTLSHAKVYFYSWRRHNSRRTKFNRDTHTLLRINRVDIIHKVDEVREVEGVDGRIF